MFETLKVRAGDAAPAAAFQAPFLFFNARLLGARQFIEEKF